MRLMLGTEGDPTLLVSVDDNFDPFNFEFTVINGGWEGTLKNGELRVNDKYDNEPVGFNIKILTENQDRLRGENHHDYQSVFNNFHNVDYVGPEWKTYVPTWDDDIPF